MPHSFLTGRVTFLHLIKNNIKCIDAAENIADDNLSWFSNEGYKFYNDQPFLTSKDKIWFLPTIAVIKNNQFYSRRKIPRTLSLNKLCTIFDYTCQICYNRFDKSQLSLEHIFPKGKGGTREIENISLTCQKCNQNKKDIYPFLNLKGKEIKSVPMPIPVLPSIPISIREEWNKYFLYKKF
jgi:hypothetical protein